MSQPREILRLQGALRELDKLRKAAEDYPARKHLDTARRSLAASLAQAKEAHRA